MCRGRLCRYRTSQRCGHGKPAQAAPAARETLRSTVLAFVPFPVIAIITITTVYVCVCAGLCPTETLFPYLFTITYELGKLFPLGLQNRKWMFPEVEWVVPGHTAGCVKAHISWCGNFMLFPGYHIASCPRSHTSMTNRNLQNNNNKKIFIKT